MAGADKRTCGIKYIIYQIDIIQIPYGQNYNSSQKTIYSKYSFGKKSMLINQSVDSVFTSVDKLTNEKHIQPIQESVKETIKEKLNKKEMRVESEDEKSDSDNKSGTKSETGSGSESEESGSESEESESDSESEEEVKVKVKPGKKVDKNAKTVVETPSKNGKPTKKTK
jgi:hypothetical protein